MKKNIKVKVKGVERKKKMIQGNCLEIVNGLGVFDGVLTSPPYNLGKNPRHRKKDASDRQMYSKSPFDDAKTSEDYINTMVTLFTRLETCVKKDGVIIWNMGVSSKNAVLPFKMISKIDKKTKWTVGDVVFWKKKSAMPFQTSSNKTSPIVEPCYIFCRKKHVIDFACNKPKGKKNQRTQQQFYKPVWNIFDAPNGKSTKYNKATFSKEMAKELLNRYFTTGQRVLDPFAGSGTTIVAGNELNIKVTGVEISQAQVDAFNNK